MSTVSIPSQYPIEVRWDGGMRFVGGPASGPTVQFDGARETAPSPVDAVLVALASCAGIDVIEILQKVRAPASAMDVRVAFSRAEAPPRRVTRVHLDFRVATVAARQHVDRAITLSLEKYCSVAASLAGDVPISWAAEIVDPAPEPASPAQAG